MIPSKLIMTPTNDQLIEVFGLQDKGSGLYFGAGANVRATLTDWQGNQVAGCINVALSLVVNSVTGDFIGTVEQTFAPAVGAGYTLTIIATQGQAYGQWQIPVEVQVRVNQFS